MATRRPTHPGAVLREDVLEPLGIGIAEAAERLGVSGKKLSDLVRERTSMSADMAVRIGKATRTSPESWLGMQAELDLWIAKRKAMEVKPFPDAELRKKTAPFPPL